MEGGPEVLLGALKDSIAYFRSHPPEGVDWRSWHVSDTPEEWERRALPNLLGELQAMEDALELYQATGEAQRMIASTGSIRGLSKQMDFLGWKWWEFVDSEVSIRHGCNMNMATTRAANVYYTLRDCWKDDEVLDEQITGLVDEADLLRYLEPDEQPRWQ